MVRMKGRRKPKRLSEKLLAIRLQLGVSQSQLGKLMDFDKGAARISEYENGNREPDLTTLLQYARLVRVSLDVLANDDLELKFREDWKTPKAVTALLSRETVANAGLRIKAVKQKRDALLRNIKTRQ